MGSVEGRGSASSAGAMREHGLNRRLGQKAAGSWRRDGSPYPCRFLPGLHSEEPANNPHTSGH